jgi:hypothetical protein
MGFIFTKIENISSINIGDHAVLFYEKNEELLPAVHSFVKRSLKIMKNVFMLIQSPIKRKF